MLESVNACGSRDVADKRESTGPTEGTTDRTLTVKDCLARIKALELEHRILITNMSSRCKTT